MRKFKGWQIAVIGVLGLTAICVICSGVTLVMDALGLLPAESPTQIAGISTSQSTPTLDEIVLPITTTIPTQQSNQIPTETQPPTETPPPIAIIPNISSASCVPDDTKLELALVTQVIDGDTIVVSINGTEYRVRYIGMDTPETGEPYYSESFIKNVELVDGEIVTLAKDVSETDQYDRLLRYVFVGNKFVNYELVHQGFAIAGSWPPDTSCDFTLKDAEISAKGNSLGMWVVTPPPSIPTMTPESDTLAANIVIINIYYDGVVSDKEPDEYVEIRNDGGQAVALDNWTLRDEADHTFKFPNFSIEPGQVCRIYTNESHPESCGLNYNFGKSAIWNNGGDCAYLRDAKNTLVDDYCY